MAKIENDFTRELLALVPFLRAFARSLCGPIEGAEDLAQEAFVKAWEGRDMFLPGTNLKAWLFTILRNQFYSDRRRAWRQAPWDQEAAERMEAAGRDAPYFSMAFKQTLLFMSCLPEEQCGALVLRACLGMSFEEIAEEMLIAVGTAKSRVTRARQALDALMEGGDREGQPDISHWENACRDYVPGQRGYVLASMLEELHVVAALGVGHAPRQRERSRGFPDWLRVGPAVGPREVIGGASVDLGEADEVHQDLEGEA